MSFFEFEDEILPDDHPSIPLPGSDEQLRMIRLMEEVCTDDYEENLDFLAIPFQEVLDSHVRSTIELIRLSKASDCRDLHMLDLGTGIGLAAERMLERSKEIVNVCLHDLSGVLLERAKTRISKRFPHIEVRKLQMDLLNGDLTGELPENQFDLVVASNLFEHIPRQRQFEVFQQVHRLLKRGGVFSMVTHVKWVRSEWKTSILDSFLQGWVSKGRDPEAFRPSMDHFRNEHIHTTLPQVFQWLGQCGYRFYDCPYRRFIFAVVLAVK